VPEVVGAGADLGVVVAFGQLIRAAVLERLAFVNLHFSLLPRWRGAAPVERAILAGDRRTGVCLMGLEETLDTGAVFRRAEVDIGDDETLEQLRARLVALGTALLLDALSQGFGPPEPQVGEPMLAPKVEMDELRLDWARPAGELQRIVRLGRAWTTFRGKRLLVRAARLPTGADASRPAPPPEPGTIDGVLAATGAGWLELLEVQADGRARQTAEEWRRGARPAPGERLGR
jgi:methionyl-tRNA formyltransferase